MVNPIVSAKIKNEAPYIIDWVAYHRALGFRNFVIVSNDCTDGSDDLLNALERAGFVHHIDTTDMPLAGRSIGRRSTDALLAWSKLSCFSHILSIDVDEFLAGIDCFDRLLKLGSRYRAVFIPWVDFVSDYAPDYSSEFVMERNSVCNPGRTGKLFVSVEGLIDFVSSHKAAYDDDREIFEIRPTQGVRESNESPYIAHYRTKSALEFYMRSIRGEAIVKRWSDGRDRELTNFRYNINSFMNLEDKGRYRESPFYGAVKKRFACERSRLLAVSDVWICSREAKVIHEKLARSAHAKFLPTYIREGIYSKSVPDQRKWINEWAFRVEDVPEHDAYLRLCTVLGILGDHEGKERLASEGFSIYRSKPLRQVLSTRARKDREPDTLSERDMGCQSRMV